MAHANRSCTSSPAQTEPVRRPSFGSSWENSFPFAAAFTGWLAERGWDRRPVTMFAAMLSGSTIVFGLGLLQLSRFVPAETLLASGLLPFVPGDLIKSAIAAGVFPLVWKLVPRSGDQA